MSTFLSDRYDFYTINSLKEFEEVLTTCFKFTNVEILSPVQEHFHHRYFCAYLYDEQPLSLKVKVVVVEKHYTSSSYLGDYKNYYVQCYKPYDKECRRIHFFSEDFTQNDFEDMVIHDGQDSCSSKWNSYLGYIVVRPLPKGIIGATLLKHYPDKTGRHYTVKREYPVNVFGKKLFVKSLPYQEQDGIVGSCASSALWCSFQQTSNLFNSKSLSPSEITQIAGIDNFNFSDSALSSDLSVEQICNAIYSSGLTPEIRTLYKRDRDYISAFLYSYLRMGIPVLLGLTHKKDGGHLVALNGYRFSGKNRKPKSNNNIKLASSQISKFYAHDDQTGPFARIEFLKNDEKSTIVRTSHWKSIESSDLIKMSLEIAIVPLHKTIVVTFDDILYIATKIDRLLSDGEYKPTFDIFIAESNHYKEEIKIELNAVKASKGSFQILFSSLPKYIWIIKVYDGKELQFDVLFDAIDKLYQLPFALNIYSDAYQKINEDLQKIDSSFFNQIKLFLKMN